MNAIDIALVMLQVHSCSVLQQFDWRCPLQGSIVVVRKPTADASHGVMPKQDVSRVSGYCSKFLYVQRLINTHLAVPMLSPPAWYL